MLPVGAIVAAIVAGTRAAQRGGHQAGRRGFQPWFAFVKIVIGVPALVWLVGTAARISSYLVWPALVSCWYALRPVSLLRLTTVRYGLPRATYYLARIAFAFSGSGHFRAGAALLAAQALRRKKRVTDDDLAFVERKAAAATNRATAAVASMIVAHLRAVRDHDAAAAERAFALACLVDRAHVGDVVPLGIAWAFNYKLAEAAAAGDFERIADARFSFYRFSWRAWALRVLARTLSGRSMRAPRTKRAVARWFLGPRGRLLLARGHVIGARPAPDAQGDEDVMTFAVKAHVAYLQAPSTAAAARALEAWDGVASSASARADWDRRKLALGARAASFDAFVDRARGGLADAVSAEAVGNAAIAKTLPEFVRMRIKDQLWEKLSDANKALRARVEKEAWMPANEEWSDVARIVLLWERLVPLAAPAELYGAFAYPLDIYSCRIVKESAQHRPVARAVAQFLLERARDADDATNAKRLADNVVAFAIG